MIDPSIALQYRPIQTPTPLEAFTQGQQLRNLGVQNQLQQASLEGANLENQQRQMQLSQTQAINRAYMGSLVQNPDGTADIDSQKLSQAVASAGAGSQLPAIMKGISDYKLAAANLTKTNGEVAAQQADFGGTIGATVKAANYDPHLFMTLTQDAVNKRVVNPQTATQSLQAVGNALQQDPTGASARQLVQQFSAHFIASSPAQQKLANEALAAQGGSDRGTAALGELDLRKSNQTLQQAATALSGAKTDAEYQSLLDQLPRGIARKFEALGDFDPSSTPSLALRVGMTPDQIAAADNRAAELAKLNTPSELALQAAKGNKDAMAALNLLKSQSIEERKASQSPPVVLSPAATQMFATSLAAGNALPSFGRNAGPVVAQIANTVAANNPNVDLAANKASYKADSQSLANLQKMRDAVGAFEVTAKKNLDQFISLAAKLPDTGVPWVNAPLRVLSDKLVGSANTAATNAAREIANNEIAKITTSPNLSAALSDSARHEVQSYNPKDATFAQTLKLAKVLRNDLDNRPAALDSQLAEVKGRLSSHPGAPAPAAAAPQFKVGDTVMYGGKQHKVLDIKDGKLDLDGTN